MPSLFPGSIPSTEYVSPTGFFYSQIDPIGIPSTETVSPVSFQSQIFILGIPSEESVGSATYHNQIVAQGFTEIEGFGIPSFEGGFIRIVDFNPPPLSKPRFKQRNFSEMYSNIVIDQKAAASFDTIDLSEDAYIYQTFTIPARYVRGDYTPPFSGIQVLVAIADNYEDIASLDWTLDRYDIGQGWQNLGQQTVTGVHTAGKKVWMDLYFDPVIPVNETWLTDRFRLGIKGRPADPDRIFVPVVYNNHTAEIEGEQIEVDLVPGVPYQFTFHGRPSLLEMDTGGNVYYSSQQGVGSVWCTHPNPYAAQGSKAYGADEVIPITKNGEEVSLLFRLLAPVAEEGQDFLGNNYRSVAVKSKVDNTSTLSAENTDKYWLSKPNPSKYGVEALYYDVSKNGQPTVVDRVLLDPLTNGMYCNVYWSNEGDPGTDSDLWDNKLWHRIPSTYRLDKRQVLALPNPIIAKYIKLEFTSLQARYYDPGTFQKPITYKKHPKWVLDYFMVRLQSQLNSDDTYLARNVAVTFDAYDLAYNYYLDDLDQEPSTPVELGYDKIGELTKFLQDRSDISDKVDLTTLTEISTELRPYESNPALQGTFKFILSQYAQTTARSQPIGNLVVPTDYPVEDLDLAFNNPLDVSRLDRDQVVIEKNFPIMFFFVDCRHKYRLVNASLDHNRAYFAGIKEVAFLRDHYAVPFDSSLYIEGVGDTVNSERSDFETVDLTWRTYGSSGT